MRSATRDKLYYAVAVLVLASALAFLVAHITARTSTVADKTARVQHVVQHDHTVVAHTTTVLVRKGILRRGAAGVQGTPGKHGVRGATGRPGRPGRDGARGLAGRPGRDAPPVTQTQLDQAIDDHCAHAACVGPAGSQGPDGPRGATGPQGPPGREPLAVPATQVGADGLPQSCVAMDPDGDGVYECPPPV